MTEIKHDQKKEEYHAAEGLNYSSLKVGIDISMLHMQHRIKTGYQKSTKSQNLGSLAHAFILEPLDFAEKLAVWKGGMTQKDVFTMSKNSTAFKDFEKENQGNFLIDPPTFEMLDTIKTAVYSNEKARKILEDCKKEVSVYWDDAGYGKAKARFDILRPSGAVWDIKTCADISRIQRDIYKYGYHYQGGWYSHASVVAHGGKLQPYGLIIVETTPPHEVAAIPLCNTSIDIGYSECRKAAVNYRKCQESGIFPGVLSDVNEIVIPEYLMNDEVKI